VCRFKQGGDLGNGTRIVGFANPNFRHFDRLPASPDGEVWLLVMTVVDDPRYLTQPFYTSTQFKREPDNSKWNPTPCATVPPLPITQTAAK